MKRKNYSFLYGLAGVFLVYLLLIAILLHVESASGISKIRTLPDAIWYSLVTLTTVGYGDILPVTPVGRMIGLLFLILSAGLLVALFGAFSSFLSGEGFPSLRLMLQRNKNWYYFLEVCSETKTLARQINEEDENAVILFGQSDSTPEDRPDFPCIFVNMAPERVISIKKNTGSRCKIFLLQENEIASNPDILQLLSLPVEIYARTDGGSDSISEHLHFFHSHDCCAREYWRSYPINMEENHIVLIGFDKYGQSILEKAILTNVMAPDSHVTYHVFGDAENFLYAHPGLSMTFSLNSEAGDRDSLIFYVEDWHERHDILTKADRIIICEDDDKKNWDSYWQLRQFYILQGVVHLRSNSSIPGIICFGTDEMIFSPEQVLRTKLNKIAIAMNDVYKAEHPKAKSWEQLDDSLKLSKIAAADHLKMKVCIILNQKNLRSLTMDDVAKAYLVYQAKCKKDPVYQDRLRQIEHLRWLRYYSYYNWKFGKLRDPKARLDPRILPYSYLSDVQKTHCDYAWELMAEITFRDDDY